MELLGNKELTITQDSLKYAGIIAAKINNQLQRKRAYASIIALDIFSDELVRHGLEVNINKNLFKIAPVNEEFEIADIYCNGWKLDVRVANDDYVLVPKSHFKYDIAADFYVAVKMDKKLKKAILVGFISQEDISRTKSVDDYYVVDSSSLKDYGELIEKLKVKNDKDLGVLSHDNFRETYLAFLDGDIDYVRKKDMIKHLRDCEECRADFVEFFDFEAIVSKSKNFPAIFNDQTLDFVGGAAVENPRYEGKEEVIQIKETPVNIHADQIVSDLFGAAIGTGLSSDIPLAAAAAGAVSSAAISGLSSAINNFEDVLDKQETGTETNDQQEQNSQNEQQEEKFYEIYDGEVEDSVEQDDSDVLNLDLEDAETLTFDDILAEDDTLVETIQEEFTEPQVVEEIDEAPETIEVEELTDDVASDEILDSDLDSILEEDDFDESINLNDDSDINITSELDDDLSFMELDDENSNILVEEDIVEDLSDKNDDLLEEAGAEDDLEIGSSFLIDPNATEDDMLLSNIHEGMAVPASVAVENDPLEEYIKKEKEKADADFSFDEVMQSSDNDTIDINAEPDNDIQFINSISDIKTADKSDVENVKNISDSPIQPLSDSAEEDDIQFIDSISDINDEKEDISIVEERVEPINSSDDDEIEFIDESQNEENEEVYVEDEKQKYQEMFNYGDSPELIDNTQEVETSAAPESDISYSSVASSSFMEAMDISDEDIETLYSNPADAKSINIPQIPHSVENIQENSVDTKRLIVLASIVAGTLLVVSIVGFLMFSNINKNKAEQFNEQVNQVDSLDMANGGGSQMPPADPNQMYAPPPNNNNMNVTTTAPKDMNKAMTNIFDENASSVTVTKIAWEVARPAAQNEQIARYLQVAGKNIVINLKKNLLNATEFSYNDNAKVLIVLGKDNNIKDLKVITSSGSEQIDEIVLQSIKETLTYINVPVLADSVQKELGPNAYTYKLVINF